jgi:hypothetical protein
MSRTLKIVVICGIIVACGLIAEMLLSKNHDDYVVVIKNNSPHALNDIRIFGAGCDEHVGTVPPGEVVQDSFEIVQDGKLELTGTGESLNGSTNYDQIIDDSVTSEREGMTTVTVDEEGVASAITEKGN